MWAREYGFREASKTWDWSALPGNNKKKDLGRIRLQWAEEVGAGGVLQPDDGAVCAQAGALGVPATLEVLWELRAREPGPVVMGHPGRQGS